MLNKDKHYTLLLVKPDGYERGLTGEVLRRIERKGYKLVALRICQADEATLANHYAEHVNKPFYKGLIDYMMSAPVVAAVIEGQNVVEGLRSLTGATKPTEAAPGTIRGDFARDWDDDSVRNIVHASDSLESAWREIPIWFDDLV
ncbi:MAG: nucleoside-diphosphate kinase [Actinomycetaceae bacterium]|nr:nucleoside-diphosphate kinase [Actinomycetaceae bacterium]